MNETSKATRRRLAEASFPWREVFTGTGLDVGCGPDKLPFPNCIGFDEGDGDANTLSKYFPPLTFDYLHGSQVLEHMDDPTAAMLDWVKVVKRGGYIVQTVPSWELYEGMVWPSRYNPDHKATFSMWQKGSPAPNHCLVPEWLTKLDIGEVLLCRLVDANFDYKVGTSRDQTWVEADGVECWIEFVIRKFQ